MKYKITKKVKAAKSSVRFGAALRAKRVYNEKSEEPIDFVSLFDFSEEFIRPLPIPYKKPSVLKRFFIWLFGLFKKFSDTLKKHIQKKKLARKERPETLFALCGALCASLLVSLFCVAFVLFLFFGRYGAPYTTVTVPQLVGSEYSDALDGEDSRFSYVVDYEYNPQVNAGTVISQTPPAGTQRKLFGSSDHCVISLKVSHAKKPYILKDLEGLDARDAILELRNNGIVPITEKEYSQSAEAGKVVRVSESAGSILHDGNKIILTVSLGPQIIYCSVPDVRGLTETQATSKIRAVGLTLGSVTYVASEKTAGCVISQSAEPKSALREGSFVDITVSTGVLELRTVPNLYGMTLDEARASLRACGLVLGAVIPVGSAERSGTVIAQTPVAKTPITSSTVSVDVYISY